MNFKNWTERTQVPCTPLDIPLQTHLQIVQGIREKGPYHIIPINAGSVFYLKNKYGQKIMINWP